MHLAKLSRPRVQKILQRRRLFHLLDETRTCQATWVCGPGGSGKTTFIASYIEENQLPCLWYQIDEGDADIAAFFYYLGVAGKALAREEKDLPFLTPEYALGIPTFTRRFFEKLFDRLEKPGVVVMDNYQDAPSECLLHEVVRNALSVIPEGINLFILSRAKPPPDPCKGTGKQPPRRDRVAGASPAGLRNKRSGPVIEPHTAVRGGYRFPS